jgi:hypothetical protein
MGAQRLGHASIMIATSKGIAGFEDNLNKGNVQGGFELSLARADASKEASG